MRSLEFDSNGSVPAIRVNQLRAAAVMPRQKVTTSMFRASFMLFLWNILDGLGSTKMIRDQLLLGCTVVL